MKKEEEKTDFIEAVKTTLQKCGFSLNEYDNYSKTDKYGLQITYDVSIVAEELFNYRMREDEYHIGCESIKRVLEFLKKTAPIDKLVEHRQKLRHVPNTPNKIKSLMDVICGVDHNPLIDTVMNHVGHCIKSRMFGRDANYPLWVNFDGPGGGGKSRFLIKLTKEIIPNGYVEAPKSTGDGNIFNNLEKNGYLFIERYAIIFGELSEVGGVAIEKIKDLIDETEVNFRGFHTQSSIRGKNNAQIFSSSNKHLREVFQRDDNIRKYCNITFAELKTNEELEARWDFINNFDYIEWIQSIDEDQPAPLVEHYQAFVEWTRKECFNPTESEVWLTGYISRNAGLIKSFNSIRKEYDESSIHVKIKKTNELSKLLIKYKCEKLARGNGGYSYQLPGFIEVLEGAESYFGDTAYKDSETRRVFDERKRRP